MLKRVKVVRVGDHVRVMGFAPAARGSEKLIGYIVCDLKDLKRELKDPVNQDEIGISLAPTKRVPTIPRDEPGTGR